MNHNSILYLSPQPHPHPHHPLATGHVHLQQPWHGVAETVAERRGILAPTTTLSAPRSGGVACWRTLHTRGSHWRQPWVMRDDNLRTLANKGEGDPRPYSGGVR